MCEMLRPGSWKTRAWLTYACQPPVLYDAAVRVGGGQRRACCRCLFEAMQTGTSRDEEAVVAGGSDSCWFDGGAGPGKCPYSGEDFSQHRLSAGDGGKGEWLV